MKLLMYGVNQETVMKEDIHKYLLNDEEKEIQMNDISQLEGVDEIIILSDDFRNEYLLARIPHGGNHLREKLPGPSDKRLSLLVFVRPRSFSDE